MGRLAAVLGLAEESSGDVGGECALLHMIEDDLCYSRPPEG